MSKARLKLAAHLTVAELEAGYRGRKEGIERSHWQMVWLYAQLGKVEEVAKVVGYSGAWVREIIKRYNQLGKAGLGDQRHENPGAKAIISETQRLALMKALAAKAEGESLWTGPKVAAWLKASSGREKVSAYTGWVYLKKLNYSLQVPRPRNRDAASLEEQEAFKKS